MKISVYESLFIQVVNSCHIFFSYVFNSTRGKLEGYFHQRSIECGACCNVNRFIPVLMTLQCLAHRGIFHGWKWEEEAGGWVSMPDVLSGGCLGSLGPAAAAGAISQPMWGNLRRSVVAGVFKPAVQRSLYDTTFPIISRFLLHPRKCEPPSTAGWVPLKDVWPRQARHLLLVTDIKGPMKVTAGWAVPLLSDYINSVNKGK